RRQALAPRLGGGVVEASPLADLPVHAGRARAVDLHAIDAEVVPLALRVLGVDERQGEEGAAVLRPGGEDGEAVEANFRGIAGRHLEDRPRAAADGADAERFAGEVAGA